MPCAQMIVKTCGLRNGTNFTLMVIGLPDTVSSGYYLVSFFKKNSIWIEL